MNPESQWIGVTVLCLVPVVILVGVRLFLLIGSEDFWKRKKKVPPAAYQADNPYMQMAVQEARIGIYQGDGGPFGSVIVQNGRVVGKGHNCVLSHRDAVCHGEIAAIQNAEKQLGTYDLSGCVLYTTGEPCPMCLTACLWANIDHVYYGCTIQDNAMIGFRDEKFDRLLGGREHLRDYLEELDRTACRRLFEEYAALEHQTY